VAGSDGRERRAAKHTPLSLTDLSLSPLCPTTALLGATMLCYIVPGLCYARAFPHPHAMRSSALLLLALGLVIGPTAVAIIIADATGAMGV